MGSHYYKKAKKDQIEIFCTVVECSNNMTLAKDIVGLSVSSISAKISSLAADLGFELFDNKINSLYLTAKGKEYYEEMKNKPRIFLKSNDITHKMIIKNNIFRNLNKTIKKLWLYLGYKKSYKIRYFLGIIIIAILYYFYVLVDSNYFFDKHLYKIANPSLKQMIKDKYYRIDKSVYCSFEGMQKNMDMHDIAMKLSNDWWYKKDLYVLIVGMSEYPPATMRLTGDAKIDDVFGTKKGFTCGADKAYPAITKMYNQTKEMFEKSANIRFYSFYTKDTDKCVNCEYFFENVKKYPNHLFAKKIKDEGFPADRFVMIKYGKYYYTVFGTNGYEGHHTHETPVERYLVWGKFTLDQLMKHDNGSYWRLITKYGIKID